MNNLMISMVLVNGPQSKGVYFCPSHEAMKCQHGQFGLGCAQMHRVRESARVRCQFDAQGWECPNLHLCMLDHWHAVSTSKLPWAYVLVDKSEGWTTGGVGMGWGRGLGWGFQHGQCSYCTWAARIRRGAFRGLLCSSRVLAPYGFHAGFLVN